MGKAAAILGVGAGGAGVTAGGNYALGDPIGAALFPKVKEEEKKESSEEVKDTQTEEAPEEDDLQCLESHFPGFDLEHERENEATWRSKNKKIEQSFFNFNSSSPTKGCLAINWSKDKGSDDSKWEGDFSWLWTFTKGNKGIVWSVVASTADKPEVPMQMSGGIYFLKKDKDEWHVHRHKELKINSALVPKIDQKNFGSKFPKVGDGIGEKSDFGTDKDYWGFVSGESDLGQIRSSSDSPSDTVEKTWFSGHWEWEEASGENSKKITEWSSNSQTWIEEIYQDRGTQGKIKGIFEKLKGNWTKKSLKGSSISS